MSARSLLFLVSYIITTISVGFLFGVAAQFLAIGIWVGIAAVLTDKAPAKAQQSKKEEARP